MDEERNLILWMQRVNLFEGWLSWKAQHRNWLSCQEGTKRRESCQTKCQWVALFLEQIIAKYWWLHWFPQLWAALCESVQEGRLGRNEADTSLFSWIADSSGCMLANHNKISSACSCIYTKVVQLLCNILSIWNSSCVASAAEINQCRDTARG